MVSTSTANKSNATSQGSLLELLELLSERLDELETRIAFQDDLINTLSEQVTRQELDIRELWAAKKQLNNQLKEVSSSNIRKEEDETPPPHY